MQLAGQYLQIRDQVCQFILTTVAPIVQLDSDPVQIAGLCMFMRTSVICIHFLAL